MRKFILAAFLSLIAVTAWADNPVIPYWSYQAPGDVQGLGDKDGVGYFRTKIDNVLLTGLGSANAYTSNQAIGSLQTVAAPDQSAFLQSVTVTFNTVNLCPCDLKLFNANPTGSTITDHTTVSVVAADATKSGGVIHISDCTTDGIILCQSQNQMIPFTSTATAAPYNIYVALVTRTSGTITAGEVNMRLRFVR